jgi:hypothetical protein
MNRTGRAVRAALVVAGSLAASGAASAAGAQYVARGGQQVTPPTTVPYPGATVVIQQPAGHGNQRFPGQMRQHQRLPFGGVPQVVYYPVPVGYSYYVPSGCGASVCDVNGRPLFRGFDDPPPGQSQNVNQSPSQNPDWYPPSTPDLSGSPYIVLGDGSMQVEFGYGDARTVPPCATSERDPNGRLRTIFYTAPANAPILRAGSRGRVQGTPSVNVRSCYGVDTYGRMELRY